MHAIIHIGIHKTGSSAIQTFLLNNAAELSSQGFFYEPTLPDWPNHNPLAHAFLNSSDYGLAEQLLAGLKERAGERTLLISSEMLCEPNINSDHFLDLLDDWKKTVIAYLRHPCDMVLAAFAEQVKYYPNMYTRDVNEHPLAYDPGQLDVLQHWVNRKDINLVLAPYDRRQWVDGMLFPDFLQMIEASPDRMDMTELRVNESLSYTSTEILRRALLGGIDAGDFEVLLKAIARFNVRDNRYPLTDETIEFCFGRMRETIGIYRPFFRKGFDERYLFEERIFR